MLTHLSRRVSELGGFRPSELGYVRSETVVSFFNRFNTNALYQREITRYMMAWPSYFHLSISF